MAPIMRCSGWLLMFLIAAMQGAGGCSAPEEESAMPAGPIYRLEWTVHPYDEMTIFVNDIPAVEFHPAKNLRSGCLHINWFLRDGRNDLSVVAGKPNGHNGTLSVRLYTVPRPDAQSTGSPLFQAEASGAEIKPTFRRSATVNAQIPFEWSWQKASPIAGLSDDDRAEILGQIKALHTAFVEKDVSELNRLLPLKDEIAKSLYLDEALFKQEGQRFLARVFQQPGYSVEPLDLAAIRLTIHGPVVIAEIEDRKLIEAGARDAEENYLGIFIARIAFIKLKGAWVAFDLMM